MHRSEGGGDHPQGDSGHQQADPHEDANDPSGISRPTSRGSQFPKDAQNPIEDHKTLMAAKMPRQQQAEDAVSQKQEPQHQRQGA